MTTPAGFPLASYPNGVIFNSVQVESRGQIENVVQPAAGVTVTVYVHQAGYVPTAESTKATVYADEGLTVPLPQPLVTDVNGDVPGYVPLGLLLDLVASGGNLAQPKVLFVNTGQPPPTGGGGGGGGSSTPTPPPLTGVVSGSDLRVTLTSPWGIKPSGQPYYNAAGVTSADAAFVSVDPATGRILLTTLGD